jgi:ribosome-binding protein aMBF1 (putative translation factor)
MLKFEGCGEIIRQHRLEQAIGIRTLAAKMKCSHGYLSKIENNKLAASSEIIRRIEVALGIENSKIAIKCLQQSDEPLYCRMLDTFFKVYKKVVKR